MKQIAGKNLALIGFMGTGKTEVGRLLAESLNRKFVDADRVIAEREGQTIREIFAKHGETYFRRVEKEVMCELAQQRGLVISAGGGAVLDEDSRAGLRETGFVVWLDASVAELEKRLAGDDTRPVLAGGVDLGAIYREREPLYRLAAHVRVDTTDKSPIAVVAVILALVRGEA